MPGLGRGFRAACQDGGTQAWACALCSPAAGPSPPCLPRPAHHAAQGLVPARGLPPKCPGLPPAQTCPGNSWGPSFSCPLCHLPCPSPSLSPTLPSCPQLSPTCSHFAALQSHAYTGCSGGPPCLQLAPAANPTAPRPAAFNPARGWGVEPPWVTCFSHLAGPIRVEPRARAGQGHKELRAKGQGRGGWPHTRHGSVCLWVRKEPGAVSAS